jgi:NTE family protein
LDKEELKQINLKSTNFKVEHGREIKKILYITRTEDHLHTYENADFSLETMKDLIKQGEAKTNEALLN